MKTEFNIDKSYNSWIQEFYSLFQKPAPHQIKKLITKTKVLWIKDEFKLFEILSADYLFKRYTGHEQHRKCRRRYLRIMEQ